MKTIRIVTIAFVTSTIVFLLSPSNTKNIIVCKNNLTTEEQLDLDTKYKQVQNDKWVKCPECDGNGYIIVLKTCPCIVEDGRGCIKCDYNGFIEIQYDCTTCSGTGQLKCN